MKDKKNTEEKKGKKLPPWLAKDNGESGKPKPKPKKK
jgi:hypothetical protein